MDGILYLLGGHGYAELLCTSLWSLRQHCQQPATVFCTDGQAAAVCHRLAADPRLRLTVRLVEAAQVTRHRLYCTKPLLTRLTDYQRNILLDADTVVCGPLDKLFEPPLAVTQFARWLTTGKIVKGRILQWRALGPPVDGLVERALASNWPAINTGVVGFHADWHGLRQWRDLTLAGWRCSFADELAMQLLLPGFPEATVFTDRYNCSAKHSDDLATAIVLHFHGRSHVRKDHCWPLWRPFFEAARAANAGGMAEWGGHYDAGVRLRLAAGQ